MGSWDQTVSAKTTKIKTKTKTTLKTKTTVLGRDSVMRLPITLISDDMEFISAETQMTS